LGENIPIHEYNFYSNFWTLQRAFADPHQVFAKNNNLKFELILNQVYCESGAISDEDDFMEPGVVKGSKKEEQEEGQEEADETILQ